MNEIALVLLTLIPIPFLVLFLRKIHLHIIETHTSPHSGQITIRRSSTNETRLYINDCLQGIATNYKNIHLTYWYYLAQQALKVDNDAPKVLISGLGANTISTLILQSKPHSKITIIERDPLIISLAQKYFDLDKFKDQITVINSDWYTYIQQDSNQYHVIINDILTGEKGDSLPQCLTREYLLLLKTRLLPNGLILYNLPNLATTPTYKTNFFTILKTETQHTHIHTIKYPYGFHNEELTIQF